MIRTGLALFAFGTLCASCVHGPAVLPDPTVPHQMAAETEVTVWCRTEKGPLSTCTVRLLPGWWVASPQVVEGK